MRRVVLAGAFALGLVLGCNSPDEYKKQGIEKTEDAMEVAVGIKLGAEHHEFGRLALQAVANARARCAAGDTLAALHVLDSLIAWAEPMVDSLPLDDPRTSFLVVMLTDIYPQTVSWQIQRGYTSDVERRTADYQALGTRFRHRRDSVNLIQ